MIRVRNLRKVHDGGVVALDQVSLEFEPGRLTFLLGPSGAGKSTLLRRLNLLTTPTSSEV